MSRITLFATVPPLTSNHLVLALAGEPGMGFDESDGGEFDSSYRKLCLDLAQEDIQADKAFASAIRGKTYGAIKRPVDRLDARNQFFALAKNIELCDVTPRSQVILEGLTEGPFVMTMRVHAQLERARLTDSDPATSKSRLSGFVESVLGQTAFLKYEREDVLSQFKPKATA